MSELLSGFLSGIGIYTKTPLFYVLILLVLLRFIYRLKRPAIRGFIGEWKVNGKLHELGKDYRVYSDVYVPNREGGYTQVDHIVTSVTGIFVIETKHYSGWIYGSERQKNWTQVIYKRKEQLYNPIRQNYGHIQSLKGYLQNESIDMYSIIVFSSEATLKFKEPFETAAVIYAKELKKIIKAYKNIVLTEREIGQVNESLEQLIITDKQAKREIKIQHLQGVKSKQNHRKIKEPITQQKKKIIVEPKQKQASFVPIENNLVGICPRCESELVKRKGKFGEFVGCSSYPACRYTLK